MEKVVCATCGCEVLALPRDTTVEIRGQLDPARCVRLRETGGDPDDPLECEDMERAIDAALDASRPATPEADPLQLWQDERFGRRRFQRWPTSRPAEVGLAGQRHRCTLQDISPGGACVALRDAAAMRPEGYVILSLDGFGLVPAEIRRLDPTVALARLCFLHDAGGQAALARWLMTLPQASVLRG